MFYKRWRIHLCWIPRRLLLSGNTTAARNIIRSSDNGLTWGNVSNGLTSGSLYSLDVRRLSVAENKILAGTSNGIFISSNQGDNWTQSSFDPGHGEVFAFLVVGTLIFAGTDAGDFMPQRGGIFLSSDGGQSWVKSDSGLENNLYNYRVKAFAKIGSIIFTGTFGNGIFASNDTGKSWIRPADRGDFTYSLAVIDSTLFMGNDINAVLRSFDLGYNWAVCDSGLPIGHSIPNVVAIGNNLIAGTSFNGVYFSNDMGDYWKPANNGLQSESLSVWSLAVIDDYVFASVGTSLWRRPFSEITSVERINLKSLKDFELRQNYPNPFNPTTTISFYIPSRSLVSLKIFDILGRKVATIINNEILSAGNYSKQWNASHFSSGVYFYQLKAGTFTETKKLILLR